MKHLQACLRATKDGECPLWKSCEAGAGLFKCEENRESSFKHCGVAD